MSSHPGEGAPPQQHQADDADVGLLLQQQPQQHSLTPMAAAGDGALAPEPQVGNVEYKLKLVDPTPDRLQHLVTQMKWRLAEGAGEAIYEIGVEDGGVPAGLSPEELGKSLDTLRRMAAQADIHADVTVLRERQGMAGKVAEVLVRQFDAADAFAQLELRVAVVGNVDAGKSTLLGVLTHGELDNGRGRARLQVFRHKHEIETGRTSSISHETLGFDSHGEVTNYGPGASGTPAKVVNFIDLAGHERYLRTTLFGMTGHQPDFAMLIIGSNMGVVGMCKEHLGISLALRVPVFFVLSKIDMCPENVLRDTLAQLKTILKSPGCRKIPLVVRTVDDVVVCARNFVSERLAPIFLVSSVTGKNIDLLRKFLNLLPSAKNWEKLAQMPLQFSIDSDWHVPGAGTVVSGTIIQGTLDMQQPLLLGPDSAGQFSPVQLKSIWVQRCSVKQAHAGQSTSMALKKVMRKEIRKGMVIVAPQLNPRSCVEFEAEIVVLYHATTITVGYEAVCHCGTVKQTARVVSMDKELLRTGDKARVTFRFLYWPEFMNPGERLIFREGRAKGVGRLLKIIPWVGGLLERLPKAHGALNVAHPLPPPVAAAAPAGRSRGGGNARRGRQQLHPQQQRPAVATSTTAAATAPMVAGNPQVSMRHSSADVPKAGAAPGAPSIRRSAEGLKIVRPQQQQQQQSSGGSSGNSSRPRTPPPQSTSPPPSTQPSQQQQPADAAQRGRRGSLSIVTPAQQQQQQAQAKPQAQPQPQQPAAKPASTAKSQK